MLTDDKRLLTVLPCCNEEVLDERFLFVYAQEIFYYLLVQYLGHNSVYNSSDMSGNNWGKIIGGIYIPSHNGGIKYILSSSVDISNCCRKEFETQISRAAASAFLSP